MFIQLCSWIGTYELWTGAVSGTDYLNCSGILMDQEQFVNGCVEGEWATPFTVIVDKGHSSASVAWHTPGWQFQLQPKRCDWKFNSTEVWCSATIGHDRVGNEWAMHLGKASERIKQGFDFREDSRKVADEWLAWGFQVNFMYKRTM